jgi:hypothetical protein
MRRQPLKPDIVCEFILNLKKCLGNIGTQDLVPAVKVGGGVAQQAANQSFQPQALQQMLNWPVLGESAKNPSVRPRSD